MLNLKIHKRDVEFEQKYKGFIEQKKEILKIAQKGEEQYTDSQGWMDTEEWANDARISYLEKLAAKIREKADAFVLIGVGGSNNAARSVIKALQKEGTPEIIYAGNTLSPNALKRMLKSLEGKSVYIDCIAKNFETLEPGSSFRILRKYLYKKYGEAASERIIATGTTGSSLDRLCAENEYTFLEFPDNIGGRYTAISNVGLLPMAVAGINIRELVQIGRAHV